MDVILRGMRRIKCLRHYYHLNDEKKTWKITMPDRFVLHPVDSELLVKNYLENLEDLIKEMRSERWSIRDFLEKSFGYCVIRDEEIVGWYLSEYNVGHRYELGIATVDGYGCRGIATLIGTAVIRHALSRGVNEIGWHCWADSEPSIATA